MFKTLLESNGAKQRVGGGSTASLVFHVVVGSLAIIATAHAGIPVTKDKPDKVVYFDIKPTPVPSKPVPAPIALPPRPLMPTAPINIPDVIPNPDMTKPVTDARDFEGRPGPQGPDSRAGAQFDPGQSFSPNQVEKQAVAIPGTATPRYPEILTSAGMEGEVFVEFVIDTMGRADMGTFKVLKSAHEAFSEEVRRALPRMRFYAAEIGGRKVNELVQLPFTFVLKR